MFSNILKNKKKTNVENNETKSTAVQQSEFIRIRTKYPDKIPVIVTRMKSCKLPEIDRNKFLVPFDMPFSGLMMVIRKRLKLKSEYAMFLFVGGSIPSSSSMMSLVYDTYKSKDGYLRVQYCEENVFGS